MEGKELKKARYSTLRIGGERGGGEASLRSSLDRGGRRGLQTDGEKSLTTAALLHSVYIGKGIRLFFFSVAPLGGKQGGREPCAALAFAPPHPLTCSSSSTTFPFFTLAFSYEGRGSLMQQEEEKGRTEGGEKALGQKRRRSQGKARLEAAVWRRKKKEPFGCCSSLDSPFPPPCVLSLYPSVLRPPPPHAVKEEEEGYHVRKTLSRPPPFLSPFLPSSLYFPFLPCSLPAAAAAASVALSTTNQGNGGGGEGRLRRETFFRSLSALLPSWPSPFSPLPLGRPPSFPSSVAGAKIGCWVLEDRKREGGGSKQRGGGAFHARGGRDGGRESKAREERGFVGGGWLISVLQEPLLQACLLACLLGTATTATTALVVEVLVLGVVVEAEEVTKMPLPRPPNCRQRAIF